MISLSPRLRLPLSPFLRVVASTLIAVAFLTSCATPAPKAAGPIRALLITGGCCHDYAAQAKALAEATEKLGPITWTVVNEGGTTKNAKIKLYDDPNWAKAYDVVVHNECFADLNDIDYTRKITAAHKGGTPAVVIHCAMHTYRVLQQDDWREFLGVTSRRHDEQKLYPVTPVKKDHPAMRGFPATWTTPMDELYIIEKVWPKTTVLATGVSEADGKTYPTIWTNDYAGTRIFGTTWGHGMATWHDPVYLNLLAHGVRWAAGREN
jgi:type 1 glutamine amidotransferase